MRIGIISKQYSMKRSAVQSAQGAADGSVPEDSLSDEAQRPGRETLQDAEGPASPNDIDYCFLTAQSAMISLSRAMQQAVTGIVSPDDRSAVAEKLRAMQDTILSFVNTRFSDQYLLGSGQAQVPAVSAAESEDPPYRREEGTDRTETGAVAVFNSAQIIFGNRTGFFNGCTIRVADGPSGSPDNVTVDGTTITVTMDLSDGKTNRDLLAALRTLPGLERLSMSGRTDLPLTDGITSEPASICETGLDAPDGQTAYAARDTLASRSVSGFSAI